MAIAEGAVKVSGASGGRFVHLHLHSEYSLLDGGNRISRLLKHVKSLGMDAVAVTDHGNLHGAIEFYEKARAEGVKPILGIEAYVAPGDRRDRTHTGIQDGGFHLVLLAETFAGWQNLLKLSTDSYREGFYYKPRMDKSTLAQWSEGLIAINGHLGSSLAFHLTRYLQSGQDREHWDAAVAEALWHKETFGVNAEGEPCFFVELQMHDVEEQRRINPLLVKLARQIDAPLVGDNDAHFMRAEDWESHDTLICISMGKEKHETERLHYSRELYVKSPEQMEVEFAELPEGPEALANSVRIAQRCNVELDFKTSYAPLVLPTIPADDFPYTGGDRSEWFTRFCARFELKPFDGHTATEDEKIRAAAECDRLLRTLCEAGLIWRYGAEGVTDAIRERLDRELAILSAKSIAAYFLIVWDFVNWARQRGIPALARGSGVGTMVGYVLGLSNACPVRYGLLFERFTDPDRSEYPDIDIDICQDGRQEVIDYVRGKYGHVAQIITFGTLKARAAIKDVGRVFGLTPGERQRLADLVPEQLNITIEEALAKEPEFKREYESKPEVARVIDEAIRLEGHTRHAGVHAAGVVVATQPLETIVPLCRPTGSKFREGDLITQWDGPTVEKVGLLKMDFLGLRTLSIMERCKRIVRETLSEEAIREAIGQHDPSVDPLDLDRLSFDDPRVYEIFRKGETAGVFQFESGGMRNTLIDMKPDRLEDLIAAAALFRPGPMELIPSYNRRKHGTEAVPAVHEIVDRFTAETYGVMVYQEQIMQICHELGGLPLRQAYTLIKAISKKKQETINKERATFVAGAQQKGLSKPKADELYELILKFAGYGFNKSHSTGYAIVAYQTAFLKAYFPNQFMAAMLSYESQAQKTADWIIYLEEGRRMAFPDGHTGIIVRPPDVNLSDADFTVVFEDDEPHDVNHGHIRFGLKAIKGAGAKAVNAIIAERVRNGPYLGLYDFCERVPPGVVNKATVESLIKAGAFDSLYDPHARAALCEALEPALAAGASRAADRASGQGSLFGGADEPAEEAATTEPPLPRVQPWTDAECTRQEKEVLGLYLSSHPLDQWRETLRAFATCRTSAVANLPHRSTVILGGVLSRVRTVLTKKGQSAGRKMAILTVEDHEGSIEATVFSEAFAEFGPLLTPESILLLIGETDHARGAPQLLVSKVLPIDRAAAELAGSVEIRLRDTPDAPETLEFLKGILGRHSANGGPGRAVPVRVRIDTEARRVLLEVEGLRVVPTPGLLSDLAGALGEGGYRISSAGLAAVGPLRNGNGRRRYAERN